MAAESLKHPVASRRELRRLVKFWADQIGFAHPFRISVAFHDSRKDDYCMDEDRDVYAYCSVQGQYERAVLGFDPYHIGWARSGDPVSEVVRHELFHAFVAMYTQAANHLTGVRDEKTRHILADLEDQMVQKLSTMPAWKHVPEA